MLLHGDMRKCDLPLVKATRQEDGHLWAHDHRRLHIFQQLKRSGDCGRIKVEITDQPVPEFKKSTTNGGKSVQVKEPKQDHLVTGWQYWDMPRSGYTYLGKDDDGEPMFLTNRTEPSLADLYHQMDRW